MLTIDTFDHIVFNVTDVEVSASWYERVLGMTRETSEPSPNEMPRVSMKFGKHKINLRPVTATQKAWSTASSPQTGSEDLCFLTSAKPDAVAAHLSRCDVPIVTGPTTKKGAMGPISSVYVRDPDGNLIEISSYQTPSVKGDKELGARLRRRARVSDLPAVYQDR